jgi:hypothetical protein
MNSDRPRSRRFIRRLRPLVVGALAVADRRANAVGPVRLSCEGDTLRIELLQVRRFAHGFAIAAPTQAVTFRVPYTAVRGLVREGHTLYLSLDPAVAAPHSRFALTRFSRDAVTALMRAFHTRTTVAALSWLMPLPLALTVAAVLPAELVAGKLGIGAVALVALFVSWKLLRRLLSWVSWGGPESDRLRAAFEHTVAARLGLEPAAELAEDPAVLLAPSPTEVVAPSIGNVLGAVLRPVAFAAAGTLAIAGVIAAVVSVQMYGVADFVILPVDDALTGIAGPLERVSRAAALVGTPKRPLCSCARVHGRLWGDGVPQLSILMSPRRGGIDALYAEPGATYPIAHADPQNDDEAELDVAVVNNSAVPLDTVDLVVTFARRDAQGQRRHLIERGLHWPGELGPGASVKWRIEAHGTELKVDTKLEGKVGEAGLLAAGADAFVRLGDARLEVVRVHGAVMLAYLGDERAPQIVQALGHLNERGELAKAAIVDAFEPLKLCDVQSSRGGVSACLFNGSDALERKLVVTELGVASPRSWTVEDLFAPGHGLTIELPVGREPPQGYRVDAPSHAPETSIESPQ